MDHEPDLEPKISLLEVFLIGGFFLLLDTVEIVLFIFALDDFWIIDIVVAPIFFYLFLKNVPSMRQLFCWLIELFPWVGALPLLSVGWGLTVWADRHQEGLIAKAGEVAAIAQGKKIPSGMVSSGARGVGIRSLRHVEEAEERATRWESAKGSTSGSQTGVRVSRENGGRSGEAHTPRAETRPGAQLAEEIYEEQNPMRRMRELFTETPKNDETVQVEDDGTVDLRKAA